MFRLCLDSIKQQDRILIEISFQSLLFGKIYKEIYINFVQNIKSSHVWKNIYMENIHYAKYLLYIQCCKTLYRFHFFLKLSEI